MISEFMKEDKMEVDKVEVVTVSIGEELNQHQEVFAVTSPIEPYNLISTTTIPTIQPIERSKRNTKPTKHFDEVSTITTPINSSPNQKSSHSRKNSIITAPSSPISLIPSTPSIISTSNPSITTPISIPPTLVTLNFSSLSNSLSSNTTSVISSPPLLQFQLPPTIEILPSKITSPVPQSSISTSTTILSAQDKKKHPRDLVPNNLEFPTLNLINKVQPLDLEDKILMAVCKILFDFNNRALCPKELADIMEERGWLNNAGSTPFAHVSTCIRSHLRRATTSIPPYRPLLVSFDLAGSITPLELQAIGINPLEPPTVKRGTLWYLDIRVWGEGVGAEDPFVRVRKENGINCDEMEGGIYVRRGGNSLNNSTATSTSMNAASPNSMVESEDVDDSGMGRGKRKRRASTAASNGSLDLLIPSITSTFSTSLPSISSSSFSNPLFSPSTSSSSTIPPTITPIPISTSKHIVGQAHHWSTTRKTAAAALALSNAAQSTLSLTPSSSAPSNSPPSTSTLPISTSIPITNSLLPIPNKIVPKLTLRLSALEEVDSGLSDSDQSDANALLRNSGIDNPNRREKKKPRRAASEGGRWVISRGGGPVRVSSRDEFNAKVAAEESAAGGGEPVIGSGRRGRGRGKGKKRKSLESGNLDRPITTPKVEVMEIDDPGESSEELEVEESNSNSNPTARRTSWSNSTTTPTINSNSTPELFSSASSSALLAQSLLAVSTSNSLQFQNQQLHHNQNSITPSSFLSQQSVISPNSLNLNHFGSSTRHSLSVSAPTITNLYSGTSFNINNTNFSQSRNSISSINSTSTNLLNGLGINSFSSSTISTPKIVSEEIEETEEGEEELDENEVRDDFHEAMLRGEDFEFEWGSESYTTPNSPLLLPTATSTTSPIRAITSISHLSSTLPSLSIITSTSLPTTFNLKQELGSTTSHKTEGEEEEDSSAISVAASEETFELNIPEEEEIELELDEEMEQEQNSVASTPATTPRSPPPNENNSNVKDEFIETPTTGTFRGGLEATLCGVFALMEDEGIEEENEKVDSIVSVVDRVSSTDSLTSLVEEESTESSELSIDTINNIGLNLEEEEVEDSNLTSSIASLPLESPLVALEIPPMLTLTNDSFSPDFNFVGHDEDEYQEEEEESDEEEEDEEGNGFENYENDNQSRNNYRNYDYEDRDGDDEEEEEDDEILTVKLEEAEDGMINSTNSRSSRHSSTCSSVYPLESFSRRLRVGSFSHSNSYNNSGSENDLVSNSLLALVSPSPPSESLHNDGEEEEWEMDLELDEIEDIELGALEELDLAWGGVSGSSTSSSTLKNSRITSSNLQQLDDRSREIELEENSSSNSFLTKSPVNAFSPVMSPIRSLHSSLSNLPAAPSPPSLPTSTTPFLIASKALASISTSQSSISTVSSLSDSPSINLNRTTLQSNSPILENVIVYPMIPLSPPITATIVSIEVAAYTTNIIDPESKLAYSLLRRIDTDFVNGTILLKATSISKLDQENLLKGLDCFTFEVEVGGIEIEGVWIPLASAQALGHKFNLKDLEVFLQPNLGALFPTPIPSMRSKLVALTGSSITGKLGKSLSPSPDSATKISNEVVEREDEIMSV